jgi:hypothetical protein
LGESVLVGYICRVVHFSGAFWFDEFGFSVNNNIDHFFVLFSSLFGLTFHGCWRGRSGVVKEERVLDFHFARLSRNKRISNKIQKKKRKKETSLARDLKGYE